MSDKISLWMGEPLSRAGKQQLIDVIYRQQERIESQAAEHARQLELLRSIKPKAEDKPYIFWLIIIVFCGLTVIEFA